MKKRNLAAGGLSVMLLLSAANPALAQDDSDDNDDDAENNEEVENGENHVEHAILSGDFTELADIMDVIEVARGEFEGVITEFDFDDYDEGYNYDIDMASEDEDFYVQVDAVTLELLELEQEDSDGFFDDGELEDEYAAKLQGDVYSLEEAIESTREYFDGIITGFNIDDGEWMDFYTSEDDGLLSREYSDNDDDEVTDDDDETEDSVSGTDDNGTEDNGEMAESERVIVYQFTIEDDHLELEIEINAADLSIIEYEFFAKDDDSVEHADQINQNIQDYEPESLEDEE